MLTVAAAQLPFGWAESPQEYFDRFNPLLARAAQGGARLVALPAQIGDMLFGLRVPLSRDASRDELLRAGGFNSWAAFVRDSTEVAAQFYVHTFETLSQRYEMYIAAGSMTLSSGERLNARNEPVLFHAAFLFSPDGRVIHEQRQMRTNETIDPALAQGDTIRAVMTGLGPLGLVVDTDAEYGEITEVLRAEGAMLLAHCSAGRPGSGTSQTLLHRLTQKTGAVILHAPLVQNGFGARAAIYAPSGRSTGASTVVAAWAQAETADVVIAEVDLPPDKSAGETQFI